MAQPEQNVLSLSHFPDNTTVGALAAMYHSSMGSSGMGGGNCTSVVPVNSSTLTFASPALFRRAEVGGWVGEEGESSWIEVQRKTQCSFQWLAPTSMLKAHLQHCHDA